MARHPLHALCPYFAMFPEGFAEQAIRKYSKPGDVVCDPFCGRGTVPFQAALMGRRFLATDVNPVAYCITQAKTHAPSLARLRARLGHLRREFDSEAGASGSASLPAFFRHAYHPETLRQVLFLRERLRWRHNPTDTMLAALVLRALHGESHRSPMYASNRMPRTISTKPAYSIRYWAKRGLRAPKRDVFAIAAEDASRRYSVPAPRGDGSVWQSDMRRLPLLASWLRYRIPLLVTSPPYFDVTDFEEDQWLRLWFLGGSPFPTTRRISTDDRHTTPNGYWTMIADFWRVAGQLVAPGGRVVVRLGGRRWGPRRLADLLLACSPASGRPVRRTHLEISRMRHRQVDAFRPGAAGHPVEVDCVFRLG